ncbi:MAG: DUF1622 domain-containing protein [Rhodomicrobium sp.]
MFDKEIVAVISRGIELSGVIILVLGLLTATLRFIFRGTSESEDISPYQQYRRDMGQGILLGLEVLVAADIISTVTISPTLESVFVLAIIVLVRTFLSFSISLEVDGRFPWQKSGKVEPGNNLERFAAPQSKRHGAASAAVMPQP